MAKKIIRTGTTADPTGDSLKNAFTKVNENFTELYNALGLDEAPLNLGAFEFTGSVISTTDSSAITIDQATTITSNLSVGGDILPQTANGGDLGSSILPWKSLYVSNNTIYIGGTAVGIDANGSLTTGGTVVGSTPAWNSITGKPTLFSGSYNDLTNKPSIPTSFSSLVNGAHQVALVVGGAGPYVTFPADDGVSIGFQGGEIGIIGGEALISSTEYGVRLSANAAADRKDWEFRTDGDLTLPDAGGIKSATDIDIIVDTPDSSTFNWQFRADGRTTFPNGTVPAHSYGAAGDKEGMVVFTDPYIYYCKQDYSTSNGIASITISTPITRNDSLHWDPATTVIQFATPSGGVAATGTPVFDGSGDLTGINIVSAGSGYLKVVDGGPANVTDIFIIQTGGTGGNSTREIRNGLPAGVTVTLTTTDIWVRVAWTGTSW